VEKREVVVLVVAVLVLRFLRRGEAEGVTVLPLSPPVEVLLAVRVRFRGR
jgi:hypothetical protein